MILFQLFNEKINHLITIPPQAFIQQSTRYLRQLWGMWLIPSWNTVTSALAGREQDPDWTKLWKHFQRSRTMASCSQKVDPNTTLTLFLRQTMCRHIVSSAWAEDHLLVISIYVQGADWDPSSLSFSRPSEKLWSISCLCLWGGVQPMMGNDA